jgi:hypothetical protein
MLNILLLVPLAMAFMILDAREVGIMFIGFLYAAAVLFKIGFDNLKRNDNNEQET